MNRDRSNYEVIVIGGGHAGTEAAAASARIGCKTALISLKKSTIGVLSCNPAIGGIAKGQLAREIDALGGLMGENTDRTAIQYRVLNSRKGPAVRSPRAQCDKPLYAVKMQEVLGEYPNLDLVEAEVSQVLVDHAQVTGVELSNGEVLSTSKVIITSGTFLSAVMHTGEEKEKGGRVGEGASYGLSKNLEDLGFRLRRLKTGTPPRLHKDSIDFSKAVPQPGDENPQPFSYFTRPNPFPTLPQVSCYITGTTSEVHEIIGENLHRSPMIRGEITGTGPRYCPSIEDKVQRFAGKDRHQIFLEPEGLQVPEIYTNGISTSLPRDVQEKFIRLIPGLEKAQFIKYGYAVEYDAIDATQLGLTLESKDISGLYLAGQVNGTSGYEEAGAQGLVAGANAALSHKGEDPLILGRHEAYAGVMVDDLTLKGSDEPYRMFTSRAEYRLLLRSDNGHHRLSERAHKVGLLPEKKYQYLCREREEIESLVGRLRSTHLKPGDERHLISPIKDRISYEDLLKRPELGWKGLKALGFDLNGVSEAALEQAGVRIRYEGYIKRDMERLEGLRKNEDTPIPLGLNYQNVAGLSNEAKGRLSQARPVTLGQVARLQGITPSAVASVLIHLKLHKAKHA